MSVRYLTGVGIAIDGHRRFFLFEKHSFLREALITEIGGLCHAD